MGRTSISDLFRKVDGYVGQVLKGAKSAELSVLLQPTKFDLAAINLKAANGGPQVLPMLLARADEVFEKKLVTSDIVARLRHADDH
jgi:hypothetical protein